MLSEILGYPNAYTNIGAYIHRYEYIHNKCTAYTNESNNNNNENNMAVILLINKTNRRQLKKVFVLKRINRKCFLFSKKKFIKTQFKQISLDIHNKYGGSNTMGASVSFHH